MLTTYLGRWSRAPVDLPDERSLPVVLYTGYLGTWLRNPREA